MNEDGQIVEPKQLIPAVYSDDDDLEDDDVEITDAPGEIEAKVLKVQECFQFITTGGNFEGMTGSGSSIFNHPSVVNFFSTLSELPMISESNNFARQDPDTSSFLLPSSVGGDLCNDIPNKFLSATNRRARLKIVGTKRDELDHVSILAMLAIVDTFFA